MPFPIPDRMLRPGLTCDVRILAEQATGVLTVPLQAVVLRPANDGSGEKPGVFVVDEQEARRNEPTLTRGSTPDKHSAL